MDLLRLVMARQPLESLKRFPNLLRSLEFLKTRHAVLGIPVKVSEITYPQEHVMAVAASFILNGELLSDAAGYLKSDAMMYRSLFLRQPDYYRHFSGGAGMSVDFWAPLLSGMPGVQARALALLSYFISEGITFDVNISYARGAKIGIPILDDQKLCGVIRHCLETSVRNPDDLNTFLSGMVRAKVPRTLHGHNQILYFCGYVVSKYRGADSLVQDPELDAKFLELYGTSIEDENDINIRFLIDCGYCYHLLRFLTPNSDKGRMIIAYAKTVCNMSLIRLNPYVNVSAEYLEKTWDSFTIAKIRANLRELMQYSDPILQKQYMVIAGYDVDPDEADADPEAVDNMRMLVGVPSLLERDINSFDVDTDVYDLSKQSFYDSPAVLVDVKKQDDENQLLPYLLWDAFRIGQIPDRFTASKNLIGPLIEKPEDHLSDNNFYSIHSEWALNILTSSGLVGVFLTSRLKEQIRKVEALEGQILAQLSQ